MGQVFQRSESLQEQVFSLKLRIPEWKVLFSVDGEMDEAQLAAFLGMEVQEVSAVLNQLHQQGLVSPVEEAVASSAVEAPRAEDAGGQEQESEAAVANKTQPPEEQTASVSAGVDKEGSVEETSADAFNALGLLDGDEGASEEGTATGVESAQEDVLASKSDTETSTEPKDSWQVSGEETLESLEFPGEEDDFLESLSTEEGEQAGESGAGEDLFSGLEESADGTEEADDFDKLIGDLIEETPEGEEEGVQTHAQAQSTEPTTEETEKTEEEFDISSIFDEELAATEQSLKDMLGSMEQEEVATGETATETTQQATQKTILVVDDSVVIRKMVEIALENENYNIVSVATGKEALQYLDEHTPDLIILDIMLTDVNGLDILKAVKASKDIPVVMLSAKDTPRETTMAKELGADDFIPKPFKDEELVSKIRELIEA